MTIDFNADLGEGYGVDKELMPYLDSCSIACGGHYGNALTIATALQLALNEQAKSRGTSFLSRHPQFWQAVYENASKRISSSH